MVDHGDGDRSEVDLPMSRADFADYLGLEVETVSRLFSRLKSDGVLSLSAPKRVVWRDWRVLADLAGAPGTGVAGFPPQPRVVNEPASG